MAQNGFRVLVYDLYGKGYSEAPHTTYDWSLFVTQLALLLQYVHWDETHVVGFSMGGGIAAAFTAALPHLVSGKVVLIASAGLLEGFNVVAKRRIVRMLRLTKKLFRDLQASYLPGYKRVMQSCYQDGPVRGLEAAFDRMATLAVGTARQRVQVLLMHGSQDESVPVGEVSKIQDRIPQAEAIRLDGATHDLVLEEEHWQIVAESLVRFLG
ncbi:alpha/beta-hydrolase [Trametes coccinea BRFM310]|uniref:Alpha/beta-hydrolase n=1 Tax=Trametes coccinea (strain BRFM310) TaxID=1353009 RepID=A0A1Y2IS93_TRAC3|nr:alpha/beta-hydrolase [Trametes coccinea BRFM310]